MNDSLARMGGYNVDSLARYRFRVLGVYDGESGEPLNDVEVRDAATGAAARTTPTGTVSLFFVPEGPATLTLHHAGFVDTTVTLTIAPADTVPVTAVLRRTHPPSSESISYIGWKLEGPWRGGRAAEGPGLRYRDSARECSGERYLE